jgi:ribose transport system ATP-binding protein
VWAKAEIRNRIDALAAEGMGILLISSELPEVIGMSDRILVMREKGSPENLAVRTLQRRRSVPAP